MNSTDFHQRHPQYLMHMRVYLQSDGSLLVVQGNVRMEVSQDELWAVFDTLVEYAALHSGDPTNLIKATAGINECDQWESKP